MNRILIIDDDEVLLRLLSVVLTEGGYTVLSTADGPQGLALYEKHRPAIVLLDLGLPSMSGIDVLREIQRIDDKARVIVVTGYGSVESAVMAIRYGAVDYIQKPVEPEALLRKVREALGESETGRKGE
jgi:DNA-binding NtrC family response regulator